jgi:hypothetical protein
LNLRLLSDSIEFDDQGNETEPVISNQQPIYNQQVGHPPLAIHQHGMAMPPGIPMNSGNGITYAQNALPHPASVMYQQGGPVANTFPPVQQLDHQRQQRGSQGFSPQMIGQGQYPQSSNPFLNPRPSQQSQQGFNPFGPISTTGIGPIDRMGRDITTKPVKIVSNNDGPSITGITNNQKPKKRVINMDAFN